MHNTQPWRFRVRSENVIEMLADWDRGLRVRDPRGRSLHVSCGTALFHLRVAARVAGRRPAAELLPPSDEAPGLLAIVRFDARAPLSAEMRELYELIPHRHTNRKPFSERLIPAPVLSEMRTAAVLERARLIFLDRRSATDLLDNAAIAEDELAIKPEYLAELAAWSTGHGVPAHVQGPLAIGDVDPVRDFGRRVGSARFKARPQLAVLTTAADEPLDWLRAGQAPAAGAAGGDQARRARAWAGRLRLPPSRSITTSCLRRSAHRADDPRVGPGEDEALVSVVQPVH
ncbi:Acg family FMN-binding oxidoreductase [Nonomuraea sp. 10N515B]|uniref:Acg family FMN-binding oxidoreductase n=1 Tax=Nonomuraea sp. 10N515B TaxID=3457422 RepID=UPI003FCD02DB